MARVTFTPKPSMQEEVFWRTRLNVAFRTAFGCFLAGLVLQLGNMHVQWATFPIFAYVMAVTIVGESTFGKALQDTVGVLVGTIQGVGMAMLVFQIFGCERITLGIAIIYISISSFIIVYPKSTLIISKRVALAHSAILYITASLRRENMEVISFPLQLAGTTMVGATSGMLALLLPFPHLAMFQVQSQLKFSTRIISERLRTMVDAFSVSDLVKGISLNLQASSLAKIGTTVDAEIISKESDLGWEFPGFSENLKQLIRALKRLKEHLVGMEAALCSDLSSHSKRMLHHMLKDCLVYLTDWVCLALRHASETGCKSSAHMQLIIDEGREALASFNEKLSIARQKLTYMSTEVVESFNDILNSGKSDCDVDQLMDFRKSFQFSSAALFFLFNLEKFVEETENVLSSVDRVKSNTSDKCDNVPRSRYEHFYEIVQIRIPSAAVHNPGNDVNLPKHCKHCYSIDSTLGLTFQGAPEKRSRSLWYQRVRQWIAVKIDYQQLLTAFKMSLAMAVGAFLGSWFSSPKGYWADITLGLGFTGVSKGGSFKLATLRAQGTVAGSIYGFLVVLATKNFPILRMVALIPWVVLTSFLRRSKLYGYAGAVSAFTGAIVILARTKKDSSDEAFTVIRIVEAFLGMASFIIVELLVMPSRATSIVKFELVSGVGKLKAYTSAVLSVFSDLRCGSCCKTAVLDLKAKEKSLKSSFSRVKALIKDAADEPEFWFSAFPEIAYSKLMDAQIKMMEHLRFSVCAYETILKIFESTNMPVDEIHRAFGASVSFLQERIPPLLDFLEQALQTENSKEILIKDSGHELMDGHGKLLSSGSESCQMGMPNNDATAKHDSACDPSQISLQGVGQIKTDLFMNEFERSFHRVVGELGCRCSDVFEESELESLGNSLLLSIGALAFSLEGLFREASELEKAVHELIQLESPWCLVELGGSFMASYRSKVSLMKR